MGLPPGAFTFQPGRHGTKPVVTADVSTSVRLSSGSGIRRQDKVTDASMIALQKGAAERRSTGTLMFGDSGCGGLGSRARWRFCRRPRPAGAYNRDCLQVGVGIQRADGTTHATIRFYAPPAPFGPSHAPVLLIALMNQPGYDPGVPAWSGTPFYINDRPCVLDDGCVDAKTQS